jgi:hypothetical protein
MNENKNIEQFFKDKFENHEINPPEEIWNNIEEKLQKKKKRRVIPFWWYGSGVAALFVIGLFVFNNNYTLEIHPKNEIVIDENSSKKTTIDNPNDLKNRNDTQNTVVVSSENKVDTDKNESKEKININTNILNNKNKNVGQNDNYSIVNSEKTKTNTNTIIKKEHLVNHTKKSTQNSTSLVVNNTISTDKNDDLDHKLKGTEIENKLVEKQENIVQNNSELNQSKSESNNENNIDLGKIAMKNQDNVATKGEVNTFKDSTAIATVEPNELEELLKEKEEQIAQEQKMNRWQVTPNLAPIYFGSFDNGSPLDSNLDDNTKSFNNNISYGVAVNYSVNKKVKIRTGFNSFTVDYNTNDIVFFQNSNARMMTNVDPTIEGSFIEVIPIKNLITAFNRLETEQNTGILNQRMGYIEMPMEISYKLFDKKFGVEVIGGMSTLFLSKNEVFLETDGMSMKIGEASNLNPVHFSTNIGVGFNYGFLKNFQARIEPTFKYQLNTFSRDSQNFKPYIFGIYTGISYNF